MTRRPARLTPSYLRNENQVARYATGQLAASQNPDAGLDGFSSGVQEILALPEEKIDIGLAALTFAKEVYPNIDIQAYSKKIDALASEVKAVINGNPDPDFAIRAMNTVLYRREGFRYDKAEDNRGTRDNFFLNGILDTKKGTCISMPMLWMAVAQRVGLPVYPVHSPEHTFLRFKDKQLKDSNIEATSGGGSPSDEQYIRDFHITPTAVASGGYMRTLSYREYLAELVMENGIAFVRHGDREKSIKYYEEAEKLDPTNIVNTENLRMSYGIKAMYAAQNGDMAAATAYLEKVRYYYKKTQELGFIPPDQRVGWK